MEVERVEATPSLELHSVFELLLVSSPPTRAENFRSAAHSLTNFAPKAVFDLEQSEGA